MIKFSEPNERKFHNDETDKAPQTKSKSKRITHEVDDAVIRTNVADITVNETKYIFASRFNALLLDKNISQKELSEKTGIAAGSISQYRNGKTEPPITALATLAKALDVSADYLIGNSNVDKVDLQLDQMNKYTGLTRTALENLHRYKNYKEQEGSNEKHITENTFITDVINLLIEEEKEYSVLFNIAGYLFTLLEYDGPINDLSLFVFRDKNTNKSQYLTSDMMRSVFLAELQKSIENLSNNLQVTDKKTNT